MNTISSSSSECLSPNKRKYRIKRRLIDSCCKLSWFMWKWMIKTKWKSFTGVHNVDDESKLLLLIQSTQLSTQSSDTQSACRFCLQHHTIVVKVIVRHRLIHSRNYCLHMWITTITENFAGVRLRHIWLSRFEWIGSKNKKFWDSQKHKEIKKLFNLEIFSLMSLKVKFIK